MVATGGNPGKGHEELKFISPHQQHSGQRAYLLGRRSSRSRCSSIHIRRRGW